MALIDKLTILYSFSIFSRMTMLLAAFFRTRTSLQIFKTSLESLGLDSLEEIRFGHVHISNNSRLCYASAINWTRIRAKPEQKAVIEFNRDATFCGTFIIIIIITLINYYYCSLVFLTLIMNRLWKIFMGALVAVLATVMVVVMMMIVAFQLRTVRSVHLNARMMVAGDLLILNVSHAEIFTWARGASRTVPRPPGFSNRATRNVRNATCSA